MIKMIVGIVLFVVWGILCIVWYYRCSKKAVLATGFVFHVRCETCGQEYEVSVEEFLKSNATKSRSLAKTKMNGPMLDRTPEYRYLARRFACPGCHGKCWAEVLNYNKYQSENRKTVIMYALLAAAGFVAGGRIFAGIWNLVWGIFE